MEGRKGGREREREEGKERKRKERLYLPLFQSIHRVNFVRVKVVCLPPDK